MIADADIWQVMCGGDIYQADLPTLKQWIAEGLVQQTDQVRKGNLRWLEAGRVPALRRTFTGEEQPDAAPPPPQPAAAPGVGSRAQHPHGDGPPQGARDLPVNHAGPAEPSHPAHAARQQQPEEQHYAHVPDRREFAERAAAAPSLQALGRFCYAHPQLAPRYVCRVCQTPMCQSCAKFMGGDRRTALCPLCGDFCYDYEQVYSRARSRARKASGFGLGDFGEAVGYPFRNLLGLVGISIFYSLLSFGGIKGRLVAYVVIFGCMSLVIKQLAWGRMDRGFLPDFSSMSLWDDVAVPLFLGLGITIVTVGPAIVLFFALLFGVVNGGPSPGGQQAAFERGGDEYSESVAKMMDPDATEGEVREAAAAIERQRAAEMRGALGGVPQESLTQRVGAVLGAGIVLALLLVVALLWAFFYYPMALAVAGYTEDFWAVVNPAVGFDTIRRMGWTYVKVFLMYAAVQLFAAVAGLVVSYALSAFDMPLVGNVPARFVEGGINFYTSLVIAALLGLALYKSSDRLGIATD
jgi:hypothetical protein